MLEAVQEMAFVIDRPGGQGFIGEGMEVVFRKGGGRFTCLPYLRVISNIMMDLSLITAGHNSR